MNPKRPLLLLACAASTVGLSTLARAEDGVPKTSVVLGRSVALTGPSARLDGANRGDFRGHFAQDRVASRPVQLDVSDASGRVQE